MNSLKSSQFLWKCSKNFTNQLVKPHFRMFANENSLIDVKVDGKTGIATVSMNKAPVNTLSLELINGLLNTMLQIEKDKGRAMILTSANHGIFSAGLDLTELYEPNPERLKLYWTSLQDMWLNLYSSAYPTAAAVSGSSPGGGCLLACSCDYRVMVQGKHRIGLNESQIGLPVPSWFADAFTNVVPKRMAEMALMSGKLFSVDEALKIGLIDETAVDNNEAITKAAEYLSTLIKFKLGPMAQTKLTMRYDAIKRLQDNREQDLRNFLKFVTSADTQKSLGMYYKKLKKS